MKSERISPFWVGGYHPFSALIIDDFGMVRLEGQLQHDFEQIIDDRYDRKATILASQLPISDWYNVFQSELIAEACLDRIVHKAMKYCLSGESLRKSINPSLMPY